MTRRQRAFCSAAPPGWLPRPGETVFLARQALGVLVATGYVVHVVPPRWAFIRIHYGRHLWFDPWLISDLRPWKRRKGMPCEVCGRTLQQMAGSPSPSGQRSFWCACCGSIMEETGSFRRTDSPALVARVRSLAEKIVRNPGLEMAVIGHEALNLLNLFDMAARHDAQAAFMSMPQGIADDGKPT